MDELTAGREVDARVAEAMGWHVEYTGFGELWRDKAGRTMVRVDEYHPTSDPAQVVPIMERIETVSGVAVDLTKNIYGWSCGVWQSRGIRLYRHETSANLAVVAALLAVWKEGTERGRGGENDGR